MARSDFLDKTLDALDAARRDTGSVESLALLRKVLQGKSAHAAAKAAQIVGDGEIEALVPDLLAAFARLLKNAAKSDPGCAAKTAIADALYRMGAVERVFYQSGIRYVQMEPVWGGRVDTAVGLRGTCALAMVRIRDPDSLTAIAELLADPEAPARRMAAQALAYGEHPDAVPLLRLKALVGDNEPEVLGECLLALLVIGAEGSLEFVARFLAHDDPAVAESAALALGGSRLAAALPLLLAWWERSGDSTLRRAAFLAIAMLKRPEAIDCLMRHVADSPAIDAREAIAALAIYRHDEKLAAQVGEAVRKRGDASLEKSFRQAFAG